MDVCTCGYITVLEMLAVLRNMEAYLPRMQGKTVHLQEDSQAVCWILRMASAM